MPERQDESRVHAMLASDSTAQLLGISVDSHGGGQAVTRMTVREDMTNGFRIAHGGMIFALADTAFAIACNSLASPTVAASADIVFVAPARLGDELVATAQMRTSFGRNGICDVTVRCGDAVVAEFRGRSHTLATAPRTPVEPAETAQ